MIAQAGKFEASLGYPASSRLASETARPYLKPLETKNKFKRKNIIRKYKITTIIIIGPEESFKRKPPTLLVFNEKPASCILLRSEMIPKSLTLFHGVLFLTMGKWTASEAGPEMWWQSHKEHDTITHSVTHPM